MVEQRARVAVAGERRVTPARAGPSASAARRRTGRCFAAPRAPAPRGPPGASASEAARATRESASTSARAPESMGNIRTPRPRAPTRAAVRAAPGRCGHSSSMTENIATSRNPGPSARRECLRRIPSNVAADARDGAPRALVPRVGLDLHAGRAEHLERVPEQQQLGRRIDAGAMPAAAVPGVPDLDAPVGRCDVEVARRAGDDAPAEHREGQARPRGSTPRGPARATSRASSRRRSARRAGRRRGRPRSPQRGLRDGARPAARAARRRARARWPGQGAASAEPTCRDATTER